MESSGNETRKSLKIRNRESRNEEREKTNLKRWNLLNMDGKISYSKQCICLPVGKDCIRAQWPIRPELTIPVSVA